MDTLIVAAAVIHRDGRLLIARRAVGGRHPLLWEFPGGKVEPGESPSECLVREMKEEMGIDVEVGELLASLEHSYPDVTIELLVFECMVARGEPADIGCESHAWVEPGRLGEYDLLPADRRLLTEVLDRLELA